MRSPLSSTLWARTALLAALLGWAPAFAQTVYSWEDDQGVHFTDDASAVPVKVRKVGKIRYDEANQGPTVTAVRPAMLAKSDAPGEAPPSAPAQPSADLEPLWRGKFIDVYRRLAYLKDSLASLEGAAPEPMVCNLNLICTPNPEHGRVRALIAEQTAQLHDAERELEQLERDASNQGIPREWRRGY